jgi:hypothetical protein
MYEMLEIDKNVHKLIDELYNSETSVNKEELAGLSVLLRHTNKAIYISPIREEVVSILREMHIPFIPYNGKIVCPWSEEFYRKILYITTYSDFMSLSISEEDVPTFMGYIRSVDLITDLEFINRYGHNRLTNYAMGSKLYLDALKAEENLYRNKKCIVCSGNFGEIDRFRSLLIDKSIPCSYINMDVICISPDDNVEYIYKLVLGGTYIKILKELV